jgi:hypothetical protein
MKRIINRFINIEDKEIISLLEKNFDIEIYDKERDIKEDWGMGRTYDTREARLTFTKIDNIENIYLHIIIKNPLIYGKEERVYSYDINKKKVCKVSQIKKPLEEDIYNMILKKYINNPE